MGKCWAVRTERICEGCGAVMSLRPSEIRKNIRCCSYECKGKVSRGNLSGANNPMWKGDNIGYKALHLWLSVNFGKANKCEHPDCLHKSEQYEWAKIKDLPYARKRENFWMLCVKCHGKYDVRTEESKKKRSNSLKGHKSWNNWQKTPRLRGKFIKSEK